MAIPTSLKESLHIKTDCRYFQGDVPCDYHKRFGVECWDDCRYYTQAEHNILIIKLGAMGDVVRTTPLVHRMRKEYPNARIFWLTRHKEILPQEVDWPLDLSAENVLWLKSFPFTMGANLDKDPQACALMEQLDIENTFGFGLRGGMPSPLNDFAVHKFVTGISDTVSKKNSRHYLQEIFEIVGWEYDGEEYLLPEAHTNSTIESLELEGKVVGLNTGCGRRWRTRLWPESHWTELSRKLLHSGHQVLLLGGPEEHDKNLRLASLTGAVYPGYFPILEFLSLIKKCHVLVTAVTMATHFAIGLKIPLVLFNNIFNTREFHFFSPSTIVSPDRPCDCYYLSECIHGESCMKDLPVDKALEAVGSLLNR